MQGRQRKLAATAIRNVFPSGMPDSITLPRALTKRMQSVLTKLFWKRK